MCGFDEWASQEAQNSLSAAVAPWFSEGSGWARSYDGFGEVAHVLKGWLWPKLKKFLV